MSKKRAGRAKLDLEAMVGAGETSAYEALELYKSRANRLQLKNEFDQGLDALSKGAICMIQHSYFTCAEVLCDLFVEMLSESGSKLTPDVRSIIKSIEESFACAGIATKHKFLCDCVRWSIETGDRKFGDPILQARLGTCIWEKGEVKTALHHFAAGEAPYQLWTLIEDALSGATCEKAREETVVLGVLQFLALENLRDANELWRRYTASEFGRETKSRLSCFVNYLLQTCERDAAPLFKSLCEKYSDDLGFDVAAKNLLHGPIASKLFNIQPRAENAGIMSMFQNLMGGGGGLF